MAGLRATLVAAASAAALGLSAVPAQAAYVYGAGFTLSADKAMLPSGYTVRLVDSPGVEELRSDVQRAVDEMVSVTGLPVTVAPGVVADRAPVTGEILVRVPTIQRLNCNSRTWAGCTVSDVGPGAPRADVLYQRAAVVDIRLTTLPELMDRTHVVMHEMGHAFGLGHHNVDFEGQPQVMNENTHRQKSYQSGDRNGLVHLRDRAHL
jgi:hypothetical protein